MDLSNNTSELINENDNPTYLFEAKTSIPSSLESLSIVSHQSSTRKRRKSILNIKTVTKTSDTVTKKKLLNQIQSLENEAGKDNVDYIDLEKRLLEVCEEILPLSLIKYIRLLLNLKKKSESSSECFAARKCRSCLGGNRMTSIRTLNFSPEMYSVLTFLGFNDFDINNGVVCDTCVQQLQNVLIFKNQCETSQISLQNQVKTLETDKQDYNETHDDDSFSHSNFDDFEYPLGLASCEIKNEPVESSEIKDELNSKIEKDELIETKNIDELKSDKSTEKKTSQKSNTNYYACSLCDNSYQLENYLIRHKYFAHFETENIYPCTIGQCGQVYNSPTDLENHKEDRHTTTCTICKKEYKTNLNLRIHRKRRHLNPHFPCSQCTRVFINKDSYERHVRHHETDPKEIRGKICDTCGKVFTTCSNFKKHFNEVHVGIKNVKCDFCDKKFVDKHRKKQHIKFTHMKYRPYKCEYCPKAFSGKEKLEDHIRVHTGEKPFICSICSRAYHQARSLQLHQQTTHNIVPEKKKLAALVDP